MESPTSLGVGNHTNSVDSVAGTQYSAPFALTTNRNQREFKTSSELKIEWFIWWPSAWWLSELIRWGFAGNGWSFTYENVPVSGFEVRKRSGLQLRDWNAPRQSFPSIRHPETSALAQKVAQPSHFLTLSPPALSPAFVNATHPFCLLRLVLRQHAGVQGWLSVRNVRSPLLPHPLSPLPLSTHTPVLLYFSSSGVFCWRPVLMLVAFTGNAINVPIQERENSLC